MKREKGILRKRAVSQYKQFSESAPLSTQTAEEFLIAQEKPEAWFCCPYTDKNNFYISYTNTSTTNTDTQICEASARCINTQSICQVVALLEVVA